MSSIFSEYVRQLSSDETPTSDVKLFEVVLEALRGALVYELKKRGLWTTSPRYLGIYGGGNWDTEDSLEELLFGCYEFIFVRRLASLSRQLKRRPNIDGLIFLNIQHFLHEAQRRHDPLGFRIYELVRSAIESLADSGVLHVLVGKPPMRNSTVLGFTPWLDADRAETLDLRPQVADWCNELMPELITAWNKETVVSQLKERISELPEQGANVFRFGDLVNPLKLEVRGRWAALWVDDQGDLALESEGDSTRLVRWVSPDRVMEEQQGFLFLIACISEGLGHLKSPRKTQDYLHRLLQFMRQWAAEFERDAPQNWTADGPLSNDLPSDKRLGEILEIPRGRLKDLKATLGQLINACRDGEAAHKSKASLAERRQTLASQTLQASARYLETSRLIASSKSDPQPGDVFQLTPVDETPINWLLINLNSRTAVVLPVDDRPMIGSQDISLDPFHVRCSQEVWIARRLLTSERRIGRLEESFLKQAQSKRQSVLEEDVRAEALAWEIDSDSEYCHWLGRLKTAGMVLSSASVEESATDTPKVVPIRPVDADQALAPQRSPRWIYPLAAGLALSIVGLSLWTQQLRRHIDRLSEPFTIRSSATYDIRFHDSDRTANLRLEATESHLLIYLVLSRVETLPSYRLELLDEEHASPTWRSAPIDHDRELLLALPRTTLAADDYRLRLYGQKDGVEILLDEQRFTIERKQSSTR